MNHCSHSVFFGKVSFPGISPRWRQYLSKLGALVLLFQRSPIVQVFFPQAKVLGGAAVADAMTLAIATVVGLGAYDSVAGATTTSVSQAAPVPGSVIVPASTGSNLNFVFQLRSGFTPADFQVIGTLPAGLHQTGLLNSKTDSITGVPTQTGMFPITIRAWRGANNSGVSSVGSFRIVVAANQASGPVIALEQPAGSAVASGGTRSFAPLAVGKKATLSFTVRNTAAASGGAASSGLTITSALLSGPNAAEFHLSGSLSAPIAPGKSKTFKVQFAPTSAGSKTALLSIVSNDSAASPFLVTLLGATPNSTGPAGVAAVPAVAAAAPQVRAATAKGVAPVMADGMALWFRQAMADALPDDGIVGPEDMDSLDDFDDDDL